MHVQVNDQIALSAPGEGDIPAIVEWLEPGDIQKTTLEIPYPYYKEDAAAYVEETGARSHRFGRLMDWAVRNEDERLIGMISFKGTPAFAQGRDEIGFWLAKPYWGKGIMTATLSTFVTLAFDIFRLHSLEAVVFEFNAPSARVLAKCGFAEVEFIKDFCNKDGCPIAGRRYVIEPPSADSARLHKNP